MRGVLCYFSGTGNTKWIADKFKYYFNMKNIKLDIINIEEKQDMELSEYNFLVIGTPIYGELHPKIVDTFLNNLPEGNKIKTILYSTQGSKKASALNVIESKIENKDYTVVSKIMFKMTNNFYFSIGKKASSKEIDEILLSCERKIKNTVNNFIGEKYIKEKANRLRVILSKIASKHFNNYLHNLSKNLSSSEDCIRCALCLRNCPQNNITFENGHVVFHSKCMMCLRCIYICPTNEIRYKNKKIDQIQKRIIKSLKLK
ncbi:EFR1 family ferrodoxin [Clostridium tetani]|uniref:Ferredoxin n=1 Tax=Clostridium tetani TaxID=1513 RepID=A0ABY0EU23_CLOTA|nr:EFR1 family ferrodoxin [Clostridium tetani]KHO40512.1 (Fe-S)-binding protein [Clostridium tetani]RXI59192.1 (Fe-S)-binding protein [Clostridium tetani]RXI71287.1 (Fe-S)-binding protein [Clostridium tetani]CDI48093.1 polyferredoxin [Clostridium tetani 12124569]